MKCEDVLEAIPLYLYGEVSPATEESVEHHVSVCAACAKEFKLQKAIHSALDTHEYATRAQMVPVGLLQECRGELSRCIGREPVRHHGLFGIGEWFHEIMHDGLRLRVPLSAMALLAVGYFAARLTNPAFDNGQFGTAAGVENAAYSSAVRSIEPQASGKVHISLDEIHRREITGLVNDDKIQRLLIEAIRQENSPGVRVESVGMLKECAQSSPVRAALLNAVAHDTNAGVRLKALEGLKSFAGDPSVRQTLSQVLLHDADPGVRIQTIDVLTSHRDDAMVGILQDVFQKEDNHYVRTRVQNALQEMHATLGIF